MGGGARFWRNVAIIAGAHVVLLVAFVRWGGGSKQNAQQIVWLNSAQLATGGPGASAAKRVAAPTATPLPEVSETPEPEEEATIAPAKSEIQLPTPTPRDTPIATPRPTPRAAPISPPKHAPPVKPPPVSKPKKRTIAKTTPRPNATATPDEDDSASDDAEAARDAIAKLTARGGAGGAGVGGGGRAGENQWYGRMLHDRFHNAWEQPTTVVASGARMSARVKVRIEKDGRVSRFEIVKPSGNVVVDESVRAVASKVTQVDPLPSGVGTGEHYDVTINFELNPEE